MPKLKIKVQFNQFSLISALFFFYYYFFIPSIARLSMNPIPCHFMLHP